MSLLASAVQGTAVVVAWVIAHLNYWVILLFMAIESSFIPFPSEAIVPPAAWLSMSNSSLNFFLVIIVATIGADIGALVNYYLAKWLGRPVIYRFANSKLGHLCLIDKASIEKSEEYFRKHGSVATFFGRLIPAVRQLISIPAGLSGMKIGPFLLFTTLGAGIWNTILALIGYGISKIPGVETPEKVVELSAKYSHELGYVILALASLFIAFIIYKAVKKKHHSPAQ